MDKKKERMIADLKKQRKELEERLASCISQQQDEEARLALRGTVISAGDPPSVKGVRRELAELDKQIRRVRSGPKAS